MKKNTLALAILGAIAVGLTGCNSTTDTTAATPVAPTPVAPTPVAPTPVAPTATGVTFSATPLA
ncbi:MAG TPA: hypothetical protein PLD29_08025, partial [Halothiobacillus sp.]|nr:hypothetical protein [Halothiobacillus sp.]